MVSGELRMVEYPYTDHRISYMISKMNFDSRIMNYIKVFVKLLNLLLFETIEIAYLLW